MLTRVGIDTKVVAMPSATYFTQATDLKFSFMLVGWSTGTGEASSSLKALLMTYNHDKGFGTANRGRYSNAKVDALTEDALQTVDDVKREALPAARDRARDQRHRHHPAALPGQPVGDARRHHVRAAHRREHARVEVQAGQARTRMQLTRLAATHRPSSMNAPHPLPAITTPAQHFIGNRWVAPATGATLPMIDPSDGTAVRDDRARAARAGHRRAPCARRGARATARGVGSRRRRRAACSPRSGARSSITPTSSR